MDNYSSDKTYVDSVLEKIVSDTEALIGQLSDYEKSVIKKVLMILREPMPSMMGAIFSKIDEIIELREEYNYILYKVRFRRQYLNSYYNDLYYKKYTRISKQGRPNASSVEAEVFTDSEVVNARNCFEQVENLLKFYEDEYMLLRSKERALDAKRQTVN